MDSKISFEEWLEQNAKKVFASKDRSDDPELLKKLGHFNPVLYCLIVDDPEDVKVFESIDNVKKGTNLILFSAAFFLIYDTSTSIKFTQRIRDSGSVIKDVTIKSVPKTQSVAEVGSGVLGASARVYTNTALSNLELLAQTTLSLSKLQKQIISREISSRIESLYQKERNEKSGYKKARSKKMIKFWKEFHKNLFGF